MMDNETMSNTVAVAVASQQEHGINGAGTSVEGGVEHAIVGSVTLGRVALVSETVAVTLGREAVSSEAGTVGVQTDKSEAKTGAMRDSRGRLLPGARVPGVGRKSKAYEQSVVDALKASLPPEKLQYWVDKALEIAIAQQSTRGIVAVLQFAMDYGIGKPRQAINVTTSKADEIMDMIQHDDTPLLPE